MIRKIIIAICLIITLLWLGFIYSNSLQTAAESSEQSASVTDKINQIADSIGIDKEFTQHEVRDMAHFSEFAVLSFLLCIDTTLILRKRLVQGSRRGAFEISLLCTLPICFLFAVIDELLQLTGEGRTCDFLDVLLDTCGAFCALFAFFAIYTVASLIIKKHRAARKE